MSDAKQTWQDEKRNEMEESDLSKVTGGGGSSSGNYHCALSACDRNPPLTPSGSCFSYPSCDHASLDAVVVV